MLLKVYMAQQRYSGQTMWIFIPVIFLLLIHIQVCRAQEPQAPCVVDIPVYSPSGTILPFRVTEVNTSGEKTVNLLTEKNAGVKITNNGRTIVFSSERIISRNIDVVLKSPTALTLTTRITVTSCRLRRSLFIGQSDVKADVTGIGLTGKLKGCSFGGDWWVRAVPMFGGHDKDFVIDGYVNSSGEFWLVFAYSVRHILIIGKGNDPVKVLAVDVLTDKRIDAGTIDLSGQCPK
jgi:hypothetical protein